MPANNDPTFDKAAQELYKSNGGGMTRYACQMREEYEFQMRRIDKRIEDAKAAIVKKYFSSRSTHQIQTFLLE